MVSDGSISADNWSRVLRWTVGSILTLFTGVGALVVVLNTGPGLGVVLTWFWIGVGVSVVYLLYKIAQELHRLDVGQ